MSATALGVQTEFLPAVPLMRWVCEDDETQHYFTIGSEAPDAAGNWVVERSAGNVVLQSLPGAMQVWCFVNGEDFCLATSSTSPGDGWTAVAQSPWYVFDPALSPPPGAVPLNSYTFDSNGHHFYSADPEIEDLTGWTQTGTLGYVYKVPMAVSRWKNDDGYRYWATNDEAVPDGFSYEGIAFYAFVNQAPQTVPVYGYTGLSQQNEPDQYFDTISGHTRTGWTQASAPAFYAYPPNDSIYGSAPLQHWQSTERNFFTIAPDDDDVVPPNWTFCDNLVQVIPLAAPPAGPVAPPITTKVLVGTPISSQEPAAHMVPGDESDYITFSVDWWWGPVFTLSHQATTDVINGVNVVAAIAAAVAVGLSGPTAGVGTTLIGIMSGFLWAAGSGLGFFDRGNGITLTVPWEAALAMGPIVVIPWPV